jgi:hypothetical protein
VILEPSHYQEVVGPPVEGDTPVPGAPPPGPPTLAVGPSREYRATVTFTLGGAVTLLALFLVGGQLSTTPAVLGAITLGSVLLGMLALFAAAFGLSGGRAWAISVMTAMLWLLVIEGVIEFVLALIHSALNIPIGALLALWALRAPIRALAVAPWGGRAITVFAALVLSPVLPLIAPAMLAPGGLLIVAQDALQPALAVTCEGTPGHAPTRIHIAYTWRWTRGEPWAAGSDSIRLGVFTHASEDDFVYVLEHTDEGSKGTWQSNVDIGDAPAVVFGVDLAEARFEPGSVGIWLQPSGTNQSDDGSIDIGARYRHGPDSIDLSSTGSIWDVESAARCEW